MSRFIKRFDFSTGSFSKLKGLPVFSLISILFLLLNPFQLFAQTPAPTGTSPQTFCEGATVANLVASGTDIKWYSAISGGSELPSGTALANNTTYYATQTLSGEESTSRLAVLAYINVVTGGAIGSNQTYCYSENPNSITEITPSTGSGTLSYKWFFSGDDVTYTEVQYADQKYYDNITAIRGLNEVFTSVYYKRRTISTLNGVVCSSETSPPVIIARDDVAPVPDDPDPLGDITEGCAAIVIPIPTATDNCDGGPIYGVRSPAGPITETTTITWTYTDGFGNYSTQEQNVIITGGDNTPPLIPPLPDITAECSVDYVETPETTDACTGDVYGTTSDPRTYNTQGTYVITWNFDDGNGNDIDATQNVIISDITPPVPDTTTLSILTGECSVSEPAHPTATDNCDLTPIEATTSTVFPITTQGSTTITWTYNDSEGNDTIQYQEVRINDLTPPEIEGLVNTTDVIGCNVSVAPNAETTVAGLESLGFVISDNCNADASLTVSLINETILGTCPILITRTYKVSDLVGNTSVPFYHIISITETDPPQFIGSMEAISAQGCDASDAPAAETTVAGLEAISGTGNLSISDCDLNSELTVSYIDSPVVTGTADCPITTVTRTYTVSDQCGNASADIIQTITITDTQGPQILGEIANTTVEGCSVSDAPDAETTVAGLEALIGNLTITDNCTADVDLTVHYTDIPTSTCPIIIERKYWVTDLCGNSSLEFIHYIYINDTEAPIVSGSLTPTTVEGCDISDAPTAVTTIAALELLTGNLTVNDVCTDDADMSLTYSDAVSGTCPIVITRTYTATDLCDNSAQIVQIINIDDTQAPVIAGTLTTTTIEGCSVSDAPAETTVDGLESLTGGITITDCYADADLIVSHTDGASGTCPIVLTRTYKVTDPCGNVSANIVQTINIDDTQAPQFTGSITDTSVEGCSISAAPAAKTSVAGLEGLVGNLIITDCNPDAILAVTHTDAVSGTCPITIIRTYTVTDPCLNSNDNIIHRITIQDTQAPVVSGTITTTNIEGCDVSAAPAAKTTVAGIESLAGGITITDCVSDANLTVTHVDVSSGTCPIKITRTYTITDPCGKFVTIDHIINIDDNTAPVITGSITTTNVEGCSINDAPAAVATVAALEALTGSPTINDACSADANISLTYSDDVSGTCPIVIRRTYTATDLCNNYAQIVQIININDTEAPEITGSITTAIEGCSASDAPAETTVSGLESLGLNVTDCSADEDLIVSHVDVSSGTDPIIITRKYTVTDPCNNHSSEYEQTINIEDTQAPQITGSITDTSVEGCSIGAAPAAVNTVAGLEGLVGNLRITDCNPDAILVVTHEDVVSGTCPIIIIRTYTVTDPLGNFNDNIIHKIIIQDAQAPVITGAITTTTIEGCDVSAAPAAKTTVAGLESLAGGITITDCVSDANLTVTHNDVTSGTCPIKITRTYTITDPCLNSVNTIHIINIDDNTAPVITGSLTPTTVEGCDINVAPAAVTTIAALEALTGTPTINDACTADANISLTYSDAFSGTCPIVITRTYTATDLCNNSAQIIHIININDTQAPVITGSLTTTTIEGCSVSDAPAETTVAGLESLAGGITITDCSADANLIVSHADVVTGTSCALVLTRTYKVTDPCGHASVDIVQTININDTQAPQFTGSITDTSVQGCDVSAAPAAKTTVAGLEALTGNLIISDCHNDALLVVSHTDVASGTCPIIITRTYTVTDPCGLASSGIVHRITIQDNSAPVVIGTITTTNIEGCDVSAAPAAKTTVAGIESLAGGITITDCVSDANLTVTHNDVTSGTCPIKITRTYSITDPCLNSVNTIHIINIDDNTAPVITGSLTPATVEGCSVSAAPVAVTTIAALEALPGTPTINDACTADANISLTYSDSFSGTCPIVITRTYTATDLCNNSAQIVQIININDTQAPVITGSLTTTTIEGCSVSNAPAETTVAGLESLAGGITITDCSADANLIVSHADVVTGTSCALVLTRTYKVTDPCGHASVDIDQTINIRDTQAPQFTGSITDTSVEGCDVSAAPAAKTTVAGLESLTGNLIITDCHNDNLLVVTSTDIASGTCPIIIMRTYTVTDPCGLSSSDIVHKIIIQDTQAPVITGTITTSTIEGCDVSVAPAAVTSVAGLEALTGNLLVSDVCSVDADISVTYTDAITGTCPIIITRTYTATDLCNNSVEIVHLILIDDTTKPAISGSIDNITVEGCSVSAVPAVTTVVDLKALGSLTVTDCYDDADLIVSSSDAVTGTCPIKIERTYTITDPCGNNSDDIEQTIYIDDTQAPLITGNLSVSSFQGCEVNDAPAETTVAGLESLAGGIRITDCYPDAELIVTHSDEATGTCPIVIVRTYRVTDPCGNVSAAILQTINIEDTTPPVYTGSLNTINIEACDINSVLPAETTVLRLEALSGNLSITDCYADADLTVTSHDVSSGTSCNFVITRTYTVTDPCGNAVDIDQIINISDTQAPRIVGLITTTTLDGCSLGDLPAAETTVAGVESLVGGLTITDNCTADEDIIVTSIDQITLPASCPIVVTRRYTVKDLCGNQAYFEHIFKLKDEDAPVITGSINNIDVEGCAVSAAPAVTTVAELQSLSGNLTVTDCNLDDDLIVTHSDVVSSGACPIVIVRTYWVEDPCGNKSNPISHTISIRDYEAPIITGTITTSTVNGCNISAAPALTTVAQLEALAGGITITDCYADSELDVSASDDVRVISSCSQEVVRTYTITDPCGNAARVVHRMNINDMSAPIIAGSLNPITVYGCDISAAPAETSVSGLEALAGNLSITDCQPSASLVVNSSDALTSSCPQFIIRTYSITDPCGNTSMDFIHRINIIDTIAPTITGSITATTVQGCDASAAPAVTSVAGLEALTGNVIVTDDCNPNTELIVSHTDTLVGTCPILLTRTYTVTDACGNRSWTPLYHIITIEDTIAPQISGSISPTIIQGCDTTAAPAETTVAGLIALPGTIKFVDCHPDSTLTVTHSDVVTDTALCSIEIVRTYTITDTCGNISAGFVHNISIIDNLAPQITGSLRDTIVQGCDSTAFPPQTTVAGLEAMEGNLKITDCKADSLLIVNYYDSYTGACPTDIFRTYKVTDPCGNISVDIVQKIRIIDTIAPQISGTIDAITVQACDSTAFRAATTIAELDSLSGDLSIIDCSADSTLTVSSVDVSAGICPIIIKRTYQVTDACGNVSEPFYHIIRIEDTIAPQITGSIDSTYVQGCDSTAVPLAETTVAGLEALVGNLDISDCRPDSALIVTFVDAVTDSLYFTDIIRTYTVTDACGNASLGFDQFIRITDTLAPIITGSIDTTMVVGCDNTAAPDAKTTVAGLEALAGNLLITDDCSADSLLVVTSVDVSTITCPIEITRTYTVTDPCGNSSISFVHIININDTVPPQISGSISASYIQGCDTTYALAETTIAGLDSLAGTLYISDACTSGVGLSVSNVDSIVGSCPLIIRRTYRVADACGNLSLPFYHVITIEDTLAPQITVSLVTTNIQGCDTTAAPAETTVAGLELLAAGNLDITDCVADSALIVNHSDQVIETLPCEINIIRTYTIKDLCGNVSDTLIHNIIITDTLAPQITGSLADTTIIACGSTAFPPETTVAGLEALSGDLLVTDCQADSSLIVNHIDHYTSTCPTIIFRTYTISDPCGNSSVNFIHTIKIIDTIAPQTRGSINPTNVEGCDLSAAPAETTVAGLLALEGDLTITDCNIDSLLVVTYVDDSIGTCPILVIRNYTVTDPCGNSSEEFVHIITINDTLAPVITGSLDTITIQGCNISAAPAETTVAGLEALAGNLKITDCSPDRNLIVTHVDDSTGVCPIILTRTYMVTDSCGNSSVEFIHNIKISDTEAPLITGSISPSTVVNCETGNAIAASTVAELEALAGNLSISDCYPDSLLIVTHEDHPTGNCPIVIIRTYKVTDPCGNTSSAFVHRINVTDLTAPVIVGSIDTTYAANCNDLGAAPLNTVADLVALPGSLAITDACSSSDMLTVTHVDFITGTCTIVINRTYTITDLCGNSSEISHIINVVDTEAPLVTGSITATKIIGCDISDAPPPETTVVGLEALTGNLIITDACRADSELEVTSTDIPGDSCSNLVRAYNVTDPCGNSSLILHTIYISDTIKPKASISPIDVECIDDVPVPDITLVNASDNCAANPTIEFLRDTLYEFNDSKWVLRSYSITDNCNNRSFVTQYIYIDGLPHPKDDYCTIKENSQDNFLYVLENDSIGCDGWGDIRIEIVSGPTHGGTVDVHDGTVYQADAYLSYTPAANDPSEDSLVYAITDKDGDRAMATVHIRFSSTSVKIPEGFSPNGDLINDFFRIPIRNLSFHYPANTIVIFDQKGNTVFDAAPYQNNWDGTNMFTGNPLPQGTYYYLFDFGDGTAKRKGFVYLIRDY